MNNAILRSLVALCVLMMLVGCSRRPKIDYSRLKLAEVSGTVTLDGEPLAGAVVRFHRSEQSPVYEHGTTDENGRYTAYLNSRKPGVVPGKKTVRIYGARSDEGEALNSGEIPKRYNRESELRVTVEPNSSHTFDFDLTSG